MTPPVSFADSRGIPKLSVEFEQNIARADYIKHLYDLFYNFSPTPPRVKNIRGGGARDRLYKGFKLIVTLIAFGAYDSLFYPMHENKGLRRNAFGA